MIRFNLNGHDVALDVDASTPLLWAIRDTAGLTGTKYGCGQSACGACTVHVNGEAVRSCSLPVSEAAGKRVVTIEGLSTQAAGAAQLHAVQRAWAEIDVAQCGYCQSGQIMSAAALLASKPKPTDADIDAAMSGVLCRCGTYPRIRAAIKRAAELA
jgi:isoquinoline 1-oxidoreductase subunit alpha